MPVSLPNNWLPDPFTAVYNAIRTGLLNHAGFKTAIKATTPGAADVHFVSMDDARFHKWAEQLGSADLPETVMFQSAWQFNESGGSTASTIVQNYDLVTTLDDLRLQPLNAVKWNMILALSDLGQDLGLGNLVEQWTVTGGGDDAFGQREWKRDKVRYLTMLRIPVTMRIPRQLIRQLNHPE